MDDYIRRNILWKILKLGEKGKKNGKIGFANMFIENRINRMKNIWRNLYLKKEEEFMKVCF